MRWYFGGSAGTRQAFDPLQVHRLDCSVLFSHTLLLYRRTWIPPYIMGYRRTCGFCHRRLVTAVQNNQRAIVHLCTLSTLFSSLLPVYSRVRLFWQHKKEQAGCKDYTKTSKYLLFRVKCPRGYFSLSEQHLTTTWAKSNDLNGNVVDQVANCPRHGGHSHTHEVSCPRACRLGW